MKNKLLHRKAYFEPELDFVEFESEVTLYTSTAGDDGVVFKEFNDPNWLE